MQLFIETEHYERKTIKLDDKNMNYSLHLSHQFGLSIVSFTLESNLPAVVLRYEIIAYLYSVRAVIQLYQYLIVLNHIPVSKYYNIIIMIISNCVRETAKNHFAVHALFS